MKHLTIFFSLAYENTHIQPLSQGSIYSKFEFKHCWIKTRKQPIIFTFSSNASIHFNFYSTFLFSIFFYFNETSNWTKKSIIHFIIIITTKNRYLKWTRSSLDRNWNTQPFSLNSVIFFLILLNGSLSFACLDIKSIFFFLRFICFENQRMKMNPKIFSWIIDSNKDFNDLLVIKEF